MKPFRKRKFLSRIEDDSFVSIDFDTDLHKGRETPFVSGDFVHFDGYSRSVENIYAFSKKELERDLKRLETIRDHLDILISVLDDAAESWDSFVEKDNDKAD